jgi:signal peptidase II
VKGGGARPGWIGLAAGIVLADQATKFLVDRFTDEGFHRTLIPGLLNFVHVRNPGIAFSLFADADSIWTRLLLIAFALAAIACITWLLWTGRAESARTRWGLTLVLGGAAGNVLDRIRHGSVIDFVDLHAGAYHWPAFNLADAGITIGALLVIGDLLFAREMKDARSG